MVPDEIKNELLKITFRYWRAHLNVPVGEVVVKAQKEGLLVITAGGNVLRMVPPLIITEEHVDEMIEKLEKVL